MYTTDAATAARARWAANGLGAPVIAVGRRSPRECEHRPSHPPRRQSASPCVPHCPLRRSRYPGPTTARASWHGILLACETLHPPGGPGLLETQAPESQIGNATHWFAKRKKKLHRERTLEGREKSECHVEGDAVVCQGSALAVQKGAFRGTQQRRRQGHTLHLWKAQRHGEPTCLSSRDRGLQVTSLGGAAEQFHNHGTPMLQGKGGHPPTVRDTRRCR